MQLKLMIKDKDNVKKQDENNNKDSKEETKEDNQIKIIREIFLISIQ
jgi:hypothetical protein